MDTKCDVLNYNPGATVTTETVKRFHQHTYRKLPLGIKFFRCSTLYDRSVKKDKKMASCHYQASRSDWFNGYGCQRRPPEHPVYRTTSLDYGWYPPTVHTAPTIFYPRSQKFSSELAKGGMYRNNSLNTAMDPQPII